MKIKKMLNNQVCDPKIPKDAEDKATRFLTALLESKVINRHTAHELGICPKNASLHSTASILRNIRDIPVESRRGSGGTSDYYMKPEEIARYLDSELRKQQIEEMRALLNEKRVKKIIKRFLKLMDWLRETPKLWHHVENLPEKLGELARNLNALLENKKSKSVN